MSSPPKALRRELGLFGATMMGLGSIIGTGIFVSMGIAAGAAGPSVVLAILVAAFVAMCNAFSSAQLAAAYPVSGGTYEYGYRLLNPGFGFTAGWMFLCAKSASAATAALGCGGYLLQLTAVDAPGARTAIACGVTILLTVVVLSGIRRSNVTNVAIVSLTLLSLGALVAFSVPTAVTLAAEHMRPFFRPASETTSPAGGFLEATALMFVAYTGYGRIATLGEEVRSPRKTIPQAIVATLIVSSLLYIAVGATAVMVLGAARLAEAATGAIAPLVVVAEATGLRPLRWLVAVGAITAMLGVVLNLILGLSRVVLAMARRRDLPAAFASVSEKSDTPAAAVLVVGAGITLLAAFGSVKTAWSFSAFTVLIYYAITNLSALRLPREQRLFPVVFAWLGLAGCLFLAFWVTPGVWLAGLGLIGLGMVWQRMARWISG